ncbi:MAG: hypothetical protein MK110_10345 [Fuerstiella sp.]|nr:hypothetical protein [Fuerstiella sp.]
MITTVFRQHLANDVAEQEEWLRTGRKIVNTSSHRIKARQLTNGRQDLFGTLRPFISIAG